MSKDVMILTGAGQIGMAIARRVGADKKIVIGDKNIDNARAVADVMNKAGFDVEPVEMDLSSRDDIRRLIEKAQTCGDIAMLVNAAGGRAAETGYAAAGKHPRHAARVSNGQAMQCQARYGRSGQVGTARRADQFDFPRHYRDAAGH